MQVAPAPSTKIGGNSEKKWELPKEYSDVQLKSSSHHRRAEVEVMQEEKPDYTAVALKHAPIKPKEDPKEAGNAAQRASFSGVELRKSIRHMDEPKEGLDGDSKHSLPDEYNNVQLRSSIQERKPEVEVLAEEKPDYTAVALKHAPVKPKEQVPNEEKPEYAAVPLKKATPIEKKEIAPRRATYTAVQLKNTGHSDELKSGGDLKKVVEDDPDKYLISGEMAAVQLKKAAPVVNSVDEQPEAKPEYAAVPLKKSAPIEKKEIAPRRATYTAVHLKNTGLGDVVKSGQDVKKEVEDDPDKYLISGEMAAVQLKKAAPVVKSVDEQPEAKPEYAAVPLKKSAPIEKKEIAPRRATYTAVQLKNTGLGDVVKSGQDVKKEVEDDPDKYLISGEMAAVQLKKAAPVVKSVDEQPEAKPEYAAVPLKKAAPIEKKEIAPRSATYVEVQLKSTGHADELKSGGDVKKEVQEDPNKYLISGEMAAVQLKKAAPVVKSVDEQPEAKPEYAAIPLKKATPIEKKEIAPRSATYVEVQLKSTGHADELKSGGDVKKEVEDDPDKYLISGEMAAVQLKKAAPVVKSVDEQPEAKPEYAAVSLKKAEPIAKSESDDHPDAKPAFAATQLKAAAPVEKLKIEPRRASYVEVQLKNTGHGDAVKSGKDVEAPKKEKSFDLPEVFGEVKLKKGVEHTPEF